MLTWSQTWAGNIRQANSAAAALLRKPKQLLAGMALSDFVMIQDQDALQKQLLEFRLDKLGKREDWQIGIKPADGPVIPLAVTIGAEGGVEGALTGLRWLLRDVTERKRAEEERTQNLRSHVEAEAARRFEFLSEASSLLASSLDYEATLSAVARLTVPYLPQLPMIYMSAYPEWRESPPVKGATIPCMGKPFTSLHLISMIRKMLDQPTARTASV